VRGPGGVQVTRAVDLTQRRSSRVALVGLAVVLCLLLVLGGSASAVGATPADPPVAPDKPPVLMLGGGLGDSRLFVTHWLGDSVQEVAKQGSFTLLTSKTARWWSGDGPDTYVLATDEAAVGAASAACTMTDLAWALDQLAARHPVGRAVLVCQGASGLMARAYLEDLGEPKQSKRADIVGLVTLGAPNQGLSLLAANPDLDMWDEYAAGGGLTPADLTPGSGYLTALNGGVLPTVVKTMVVRGSCASLCGSDTDGVATLQEQTLPAGVVSGALEAQLDVQGRASDVWSLKDSWFPKTRLGGEMLNPLDASEVDRLELVRSYVTMPEVQAAVKTFYTAWFSNGAPTTHISSRLVVDVSGSMDESLRGVKKIASAREACATFADAMAARVGLKEAVPEDLALITFNTSVRTVAGPTSDPGSVKTVSNTLRAGGSTDIGLALQAAVDSFASAPGGAQKVVVLLSDGEVTTGLNDQAVLSGPVAAASSRHIRIDTVGLGRLTSGDKAFLQQVASATGGSFSEALDGFELSRDFLRTRYESLGTLAVDSEIALPEGKPVTVDVARVEAGSVLMEIGLVPDGEVGWKLSRDGQPVPEDAVNVDTGSGRALALTLENPVAGNYVLELTKTPGVGDGRAHVFVVAQRDLLPDEGVAVGSGNGALLLLIVVCLIAVVTLGLALVLTARGARGGGGRKASSKKRDVAEAGDMFDGPPSAGEDSE
jgi:hypothetical protein